MPNSFIPTDFNNLKVDPSVQDKVLQLNAVKQEITNLLSTPKGTREGNFSFGLSIYDHLLSENLDENGIAILAELAREIEAQILGVTINLSQSSITPDFDRKIYKVYLSCQVSFLENQSLLLSGAISG